MIFNEAYYYASKVNLDQYPELEIDNDFILDFMSRYDDKLSKDIVFAFVYVILGCMKTPPKKVKRFNHLLWDKIGFEGEYLSEILCAGNGRISEIGHTDFAVTNGYIEEPFTYYNEVDWEEYYLHYSYISS